MYPDKNTPTLEQIKEWLKLYHNATLTLSNRKYDETYEYALDQFEHILDFIDDLEAIDFTEFKE